MKQSSVVQFYVCTFAVGVVCISDTGTVKSTRIYYSRKDRTVFVYTHENQFGVKKQHGTDTCIYVMKEIINRYHRLGSSIYLCFLDVSKAFDRINHDILFKKLVNRNVPAYIVRLLVFWYSHQQNVCKMGKCDVKCFYCE